MSWAESIEPLTACMEEEGGWWCSIPTPPFRRARALLLVFQFALPAGKPGPYPTSTACEVRALGRAAPSSIKHSLVLPRTTNTNCCTA
jgi:hypothetical protein